MTSNFTSDKQEEARTARLTQQTDALKHFLERKHPEIRFCEAFLGEIKDYMLGSFFTATEEDFEYALQNIDVSGLHQHVPTPAEAREQLVEDICEKLRSPDGTGKGGRYSDIDLKALKLQMRWWSIEQLKAKLATVTTKQEQVKMSVPELRQIVRDSQPERRVDGYPRLPEFLVPEGQIQAIKCDSTYLLNLARTDFYLYKKLVSRFGSSQITERQQS